MFAVRILFFLVSDFLKSVMEKAECLWMMNWCWKIVYNNRTSVHMNITFNIHTFFITHRLISFW